MDEQRPTGKSVDPFITERQDYASLEQPAAPPDQNDAAPTPLDAEEKNLRLFWRELGREAVQRAIQRVDSGGRFLIALDAVLGGLLINALVMGGADGRYADPAARPGAGEVMLYLLPVLFLVLSLMFAGGIFFLDKPDIDLRSARGVREGYMETVKNKMFFLRTSLIMLTLAIVAAAAALWVFLLK